MAERLNGRSDGRSISAKCLIRTAEGDSSSSPVTVYPTNQAGFIEGSCNACGRNCGPVIVVDTLIEEKSRDPEIWGKIVVIPQSLGEKPTLKRTP